MRFRYAISRIKRRILSGSKYPPQVCHLIESASKNIDSTANSKVCINLSFDLELALNGKFWRGENKKALICGEKALENLEPICLYLNKEGLQYNVQIVTGLLDYQHLLDKKYFTQQQVNIIKNNQRLFQLSENIKNLFKKTNVEIGIHGFSHRPFNELDESQAREEIEEARELVRLNFDVMPKFMSFPRNQIAYLDILKQYDMNHRSDQGISLGLWFSPFMITPKELDYVIKTSKINFFHLWQHFIEMNLEELKEYLDVFKQNNCSIINLRSV